MPLTPAEANELLRLIQVLIDRRDRLQEAITLDMPQHLLDDQQEYAQRARADLHTYVGRITKNPKPTR